MKRSDILDALGSIAIIILIIFLAMFTMNIVHAEPRKTICILDPVDTFTDKSQIKTITSQIFKHNQTMIHISLKDTIKGNLNGCDIRIHIEKAINTNDRWILKDTRYLVLGNDITIFIQKTDKPLNLSPGETRVMTNPICLWFALNHRESHFEFNHPSRLDCGDPYILSHHENQSLAPDMIRKSVDQALERLQI